MSRGSLGSPPPPDPSSAAEIEAEKVVRLISERATAAQAESLWAAGTVPIGGARAVKPTKAPKAASAVNGAEASGAYATGSRTAANSATGPDTTTAANRVTATAADNATGPDTATAADATTGADYAADLAAFPGLAGSGWLEPLRSTWSTTAIAALIIPALIVLIVALL